MPLLEREAVPLMLVVGCTMPMGTLRLVWLVPVGVDELAVELPMAVRSWLLFISP